MSTKMQTADALVGKDAEVMFAQAVNMALDDAMASDPKVLVFGEDVADPEGGGIIGVSRGLSSKYGDDRVKSTPIAEQAIMGAAVGAALVGYKPVAEIMLMNFITVAMDMIVNHAAKLRFMSGGQTHVPLVIRTMTGAGTGNGGQHSDYLEAWFAHTAGMKVVVASNAQDAYGLMRSAIDDPDPVLFIEPIALLRAKFPTPKRGEFVPLGKARMHKEGKDITIVSYGRMFNTSVAALSKMEGVDAELIDLRTVSPWDEEMVLASVAKTGRCVIVHEAVRKFGVGAEIAQVITEKLFKTLKAPVGRVGAPYSPVPFAKALETLFVPSEADIQAAVKAALA